MYILMKAKSEDENFIDSKITLKSMNPCPSKSTACMQYIFERLIVLCKLHTCVQLLHLRIVVKFSLKMMMNMLD